MVDRAILSSPESTSANALRIAAYELEHPSGLINVFYEARADMPSYVAAIRNSAVGASKNHATLVNKSNRIIRVRKIKIMQNITAAVTGVSYIMLNVQGLDPALAKPTGGTAITPRKLNTTFQNLPTTPGPIEVIAAPTANINVVANYFLDEDTLSIEETPTTNRPVIELLKKESELSCLILNQDQGITIQQGTVVGVGAINIYIYWTLD